MKQIIKTLQKGMANLVFPNVCLVCGNHLSGEEKFLCGLCTNERFENGAPPEFEILPEAVSFRFALWNFDKGGYLQDLLHQLKYNRMSSVGEDLGAALGNELKVKAVYQEIENESEILILPVPLHPQKKRKRGYNQAFHIALGMKRVLDYKIVEERDVVRVVNTKTQTGFSLEKRRENINGAFKITNQSTLENKHIIIVDDVFTTGATTFELASVLKSAGVAGVSIATVAQA